MQSDAKYSLETRQKAAQTVVTGAGTKFVITPEYFFPRKSLRRQRVVRRGRKPGILARVRNLLTSAIGRPAAVLFAQERF